MLWKILLVFLFIWLVLIIWRRRKLLALYRQISCDVTWLPFIGHSYTLIGNAEDQMKGLQMLARATTKKGGVAGMWHALSLYVMITDPVAAECVLKTCLNKDDILKVTQVVLGNGSIFASVPVWRPRRKVLAPTFSPKRLINFVDIFAKQSIVLAEKMKSVVGKGPASMWEYMNTYAMDAVCETTMGVKVESQKDPNHPFLKSMETLFQQAAMRMTLPWLYHDFVYTNLPYYTTTLKCKAHICDFLDKIIKEINSNKNNKCNDSKTSDNNQDMEQEPLKTFIDLMIESSTKEISRGYTDLELREETLVLLGAGSDTSAVGIAFTIVMMSKHLDVQDKVYQELQEVFGDSDRPLVAEDLPHLKYLEAVLKETLRLYPPVPIIARKVETDVTLPSGVTLVNGCTVIINIWGTHRNPQYWGEDAEVFRPERFLDTPLKHPAAFMPFSYGPRNCLGYQYAMMSMKTAISTILRKYKFFPADARAGDTTKPLRVKFNIMMRDVDNYTVRLEHRK